MKNNWIKTKIKDYCKTNYETYSLSENWDYINYLDTGSITKNQVSEIQRLTSSDDIPSRARRKVAKNDIIYSTVRPNQRHYGILKDVLPNMLVSTGFVVITANNTEMDSNFLYYYLTQDEIVDNLHAIAEQSVSTYPSIKSSDIENIEMFLPPLPTQRATARILSALDDKIENNIKINQTLEQMAQAIFKSWFVEFKPSKYFTDIVQILGGGTPKTDIPEYWDGNIPFFTPKDALSLFTLSTEKYLTQTGLNSCSSRLYPENTVFVTARGTVGKISLAGAPMAMNQSCYALIGKKGFGQYFVYHLTLDIIAKLKHKASGAVFDAIVTRDFESEFVPSPEIGHIKSFEEKVTAIYEKIKNNSEENLRLAAIRDTLLPKLMNGEIEVLTEGA